MKESRDAKEGVQRWPWRKAWYQRLHAYNCGEIGEQELLAAAGSSRINRCEAHFFIGITRLGDGDRVGARQHFEQAEAMQIRDYLEYRWGRVFAARMRADPAWPRWVPRGR